MDAKDNITETIIEAFDNHLMNDEDAEKWINAGNTITFKFSKGETEVSTKEVKPK